MLLIVASFIAIWALGFLFVAATASISGRAGHEANKRLADGGVLSSLKGELSPEGKTDEPRSNLGLAYDIKADKLLPQGKLSEEATDEVIGAKI